MATDKQIDANRLNSQLSTGPRSDDGKAVSRFNALKHGLDARSHVIPGEDAAEFESLGERYYTQFLPEGPAEEMLVRTMVESDWLGRRYAAVETALIAGTVGAADPKIALPDLFGKITAKHNALPHVFRRRDAAKRDWFRALKELQRLQKERRAAEPEDSKQNAAEIGFVPERAETPSRLAPEPAVIPAVGHKIAS